MSIFLQSLKDDLLITLSVEAGCLIVANLLEMRSHPKWRTAVGFFVPFAWMVASRFYLALNPATSSYGLFIRYIILFFLFSILIFFWCKADLCQTRQTTQVG